MRYFYTCQGNYKNNIIIENFKDDIIEHLDDEQTDFNNFIDTFSSSGEFSKLGLVMQDDVLDTTLITTLTQNDIPNEIASNLVNNYIPPIIDSDGKITQENFLDTDTPTKYRNNIINDINFKVLNCGQQSLCLGHIMKYVCSALIIRIKTEIVSFLDEFKQDIVNRTSKMPILSNSS